MKGEGNTDLGDGSFWIKIRDAKDVDQCLCGATSSAVVELNARRRLTKTFRFSHFSGKTFVYHIFTVMIF